MEVWFVRHAIAADRAPHSDADADRPLTEQGRELFRDLADFLVKTEATPQLVVASPLVRAVQTAELLSKAAGLKKKEVLVDPVLSPGINLERLVGFLRHQSVERVALVGHEPDMSRCTTSLVGGGRISFGKGNIACIRFDGVPADGAGVLQWFVGPKMV